MEQQRLLYKLTHKITTVFEDLACVELGHELTLQPVVGKCKQTGQDYVLPVNVLPSV